MYTYFLSPLSLSRITANDIVAVANLVEANGSGTSGRLFLVQSGASSEVNIQGHVSNLKTGTHGFHVHTSGDTKNDCANAGGHFNPTSVSR